MGLRTVVMLALVAGGALWLLLDSRDARPVPELVPAPVGAPERPVDETALEAPRPPERDIGAPRANETTRAALSTDPPPSPQPGSKAGTSRGRLVDEATLEPIPEALVVTDKLNDWTDGDGWFDTGEPLDDLTEVLVLNVSDNTNSPEVARERWTRLADAWQVPLAIGPTFRLRFSGVESAQGRAWEGRLVRDGGGEEGWLPLRDGPAPYLRYDRPFGESPGEHWVEARSQDGLYEGRGEVLSLVGVQEVEIPCRPRAVLRGRVVDENGGAFHDFTIDGVLSSENATEPMRTTTGKDGSYQFSLREPGRMRVTILPPSSTTTRKLTVDVPRGVTQAPDLVLERRSPAGAIRGRLLRRSAAEHVEGTIRLRALDASGYEQRLGFPFNGPEGLRRGTIGRIQAVTGDTEEFVFQQVPQGRFELSFSSKEGYACAPASMEVQAPAEDLTFLVDNTVPLRVFVLELRDADSHVAPNPIYVRVRIDGASSLIRTTRESDGTRVELPAGVGFEWIASAPGYRMEHGSERDFVPRGESLVATRALRRGFGVRLELFEQPEGEARTDPTFATIGWSSKRVAGADVFADGVLVATSDENGIADLDLPAAPERIEIRRPGWRVLASPWFRDGKVQSFPAAQLWMIRE